MPDSTTYMRPMSQAELKTDSRVVRMQNTFFDACEVSSLKTTFGGQRPSRSSLRAKRR